MTRRYPFRRGKLWNQFCEVNIVEQCNLACRSCSHLSPILPRYVVAAADLFRDLELLSRCYHVDGLKLLGGEPLLHPDLPEVAAAVRRSGIADRVVVITNGTLLPRMREDFWSSVDEVSVSVYRGAELAVDEIEEVKGRARAHRVKLRFQIFRRFRESFAIQGTDDPVLVQRIFDSCKIAHDWRCHTVANGYFYKCSKAYFLEKMFGPGGAADAAANSIEITASPAFAESFRAYLESPRPLEACTRCLGTAGRHFDHEQVQRPEWLALQEGRSEDLLDLDLLAADELRTRLPRPVRRVAERIGPRG